MTVRNDAGAVDQQRLSRARSANRSTAGRWADYASHRARVTDLIASRVHDGDRVLCVLGAGNGNDLDLARLAALFDRIHLVDIDADALRACTSRHPVAAAEVCEHGHVDLSAVTGEELVQTVGERADVVVSATVLTQLIDDAHATAPAPLTADTLAVVRATHLSQMISLTRTGGAGALVSDLVSTHTLPALDAVADRALPQLMLAALQAGNFFAGINPYAVCAHLADGAGRPERVEDVTLHPPWVWRMSCRTSRLTYAVSYRRPVSARLRMPHPAANGVDGQPGVRGGSRAAISYQGAGASANGQKPTLASFRTGSGAEERGGPGARQAWAA